MLPHQNGICKSIRTLVSIPAGLARMNFLMFLTTTFIGAYVWCTLLIGAGYFLGHEWYLIGNYVKQSFLYLVIVGALAMVANFLRTRIVLSLARVKIRNSD